MKYFVLSIATLGMVACGENAPETPTTEHVQSSTMAQSLELSDAYIKAPLPSRNITAGFFKLKNNGANDRLIAASSSISDTVEIHTHLMEGGVMKMRQIPGVGLPSGETVEFKSGGYHLMLFNVVLPEGQSDAQITLTFENNEPMTITVPIGQGQAETYGSGSEY